MSTTRTDALSEHLSAIAELLDDEDDPRERTDLWRGVRLRRRPIQGELHSHAREAG